jgi:PhnB protein
MQSILNPYLSFRDTARTAMEFYQTVFGGKLTFSTFKEFHVSQDPREDNKIMHGMLQGANGITLMGADTPDSMEHSTGSNISISLSGDNHAELATFFEKLSSGGTITEPLTQAPWGDSFGMLVDKFGIHWMVNIAGKKS